MFLYRKFNVRFHDEESEPEPLTSIEKEWDHFANFDAEKYNEEDGEGGEYATRSFADLVYIHLKDLYRKNKLLQVKTCQ